MSLLKSINQSIVWMHQNTTRDGFNVKTILQLQMYILLSIAGVKSHPLKYCENIHGKGMQTISSNKLILTSWEQIIDQSVPVSQQTGKLGTGNHCGFVSYPALLSLKNENIKNMSKNRLQWSNLDQWQIFYYNTATFKANRYVLRRKVFMWVLHLVSIVKH